MPEISTGHRMSHSTRGSRSVAATKIKARNADGKPICGAKTRAGGQCKKHPMPNGRCKFHGGKSPGGKKGVPGTGNLKHGIYSRFLTDEEKELSARIEMGAVDEEIKMCRVRLYRIMKVEQEAAGEVQLRLDEVKHRTFGLKAPDEDDDKDEDKIPETTKVHRRFDFEDAVDRLIRRIESLEKTRQTLIGDTGTEADSVLDELLDELDD